MNCPRCGEAFSWVRKAGGWVPMNADGSRHKCPMADSNKRQPIVHGPRITGLRYTPSCAACTVPPWESCACSALLARAA